MGNQKFKLSDMIPNAWFFKLKDMTSKPPPKNPKKHRLPPPPPRPPPPPSSSPPSSTVETAQEVEPQCHPRKSYHIARDPPISPPRKSKSRKHHSTRKNSTAAANHHRQFSLSSSVSTTCTCRTTTTTTDDFLSPTITDEPQKPEERFDIVIDVSNSYGFDIELPRIATKPTITKPRKISPNSKEHHQPKVISRSPPSRRFLMSSSSGVRLKVNSPKIMARKQGQSGNLLTGGRKTVGGGSSRRSISESFAVVKSSRDPQKDFRESMVDMIVQNNLRASKDLEDLLACYLSLNSDEYHDLIIKVFKQIWFDLIHLRPHKQVVSS